MSLAMVLSLPPLLSESPRRLPRPLLWALSTSVGLHGLALLWQSQAPAAPFPDAAQTTLRVMLLTQQEQPALQPPNPAATSSVRPGTAVAPMPGREPPRARTMMTRTQSDAQTTAIRPTAPTIAATPSPEAAPPPAAGQAPTSPLVAQAPARPETVPDTPRAEEAPDPALLERYGRSLSKLLALHQQYPRLAALRGWEGEVQLRLTIARKGNIIATQVMRSSGYEVLDQSAIQLVASAGPLPRPPEALQNRELQIIVPVFFKLEKAS